MKAIREIRGERRLSQRELASRAGLSFGCVQRMEKAAHDWRVESMRRLAHGLNLPSGGVDFFVEHYLNMVPDSVEDISFQIFRDGFDSWPIQIFNFVDRFRAEPDVRLIRHAPVQVLDARLHALIASTVESLCAEAGLHAPDWCRGIPGLQQPWFVSGMENLKAMALVESPPAFRKRNIFVLGNFLNRV